MRVKRLHGQYRILVKKKDVDVDVCKCKDKRMMIGTLDKENDWNRKLTADC